MRQLAPEFAHGLIRALLQYWVIFDDGSTGCLSVCRISRSRFANPHVTGSQVGQRGCCRIEALALHEERDRVLTTIGLHHAYRIVEHTRSAILGVCRLSMSRSAQTTEQQNQSQMIADPTKPIHLRIHGYFLLVMGSTIQTGSLE